MVIVEPRQHPQLQAALLNFDECIPTDWDMVIFHGASHGDYAQQCAHGIHHRRVIFQSLADNTTHEEYNYLMKSEAFWGRVDAEHILLFQTDTAACCAFPGSPDDFLGIAYAGCPYDHQIGKGALPKYWQDAHFYGNGGLSFRSKSFMLDCIRAHPHLCRDVHPLKWEDSFYSNCVASSPNRPKYVGVLAHLCTLNSFMALSLGAHQLGGGTSQGRMPEDQRDAFLEYCPEARRLYGNSTAAGGALLL